MQTTMWSYNNCGFHDFAAWSCYWLLQEKQTTADYKSTWVCYGWIWKICPGAADHSFFCHQLLWYALNTKVFFFPMYYSTHSNQESTFRNRQQCWCYISSRQRVGYCSKVDPSFASSSSIPWNVSRTSNGGHLDAGTNITLFFPIWADILFYNCHIVSYWCSLSLGTQHSKTAYSY